MTCEKAGVGRVRRRNSLLIPITSIGISALGDWLPVRGQINLRFHP